MSSSTFEEWKEPKSLFPELPPGAGTGADICVIIQPLLQPQSELQMDARIYYGLFNRFHDIYAMARTTRRVRYFPESGDYLTFVEEFLLKNEPCVFLEAVTNGWRARREWQRDGKPDLEYLAKEFGEQIKISLSLSLSLSLTSLES